MARQRRAALLLISLVALFFIFQSILTPLAPVDAEADTILAPVAVSANGKYLLDSAGQPFFWFADTAWVINQRLTREEISAFLDDRKQKGFTVILIRIPHFEKDEFPNPANQYGLRPFINKDISRPVEEYFELVDYTLTEMENRGLVAGFLPLWGYVVGGKYDYSVTEQEVIDYGRWISNRYKERKNIVWVAGGDSGFDDKWIALGRELKAADPQKLVAFHPGRKSFSSYHLYGDADWLDFHMTQSGHSLNLPDNYLTINEVYNASNKPILNAEPIYEDIAVKKEGQPTIFAPPHQVRKSAYWSLLAGGFGHVYGHADSIRLKVDWMGALDAPGAKQMSVLISLLRSVPWDSFRPMQSLIASSNPSGGAHIRAAASADNRIAFIYFPEQQPATIQLSEMEGPLNLRWFDPQSGSSQNLGVVQASGTMNVSPPFAPDAAVNIGTGGWFGAHVHAQARTANLYAYADNDAGATDRYANIHSDHCSAHGDGYPRPHGNINCDARWEG